MKLVVELLLNKIDETQIMPSSGIDYLSTDGKAGGLRSFLTLNNFYGESWRQLQYVSYRDVYTKNTNPLSRNVFCIPMSKKHRQPIETLGAQA